MTSNMARERENQTASTVIIDILSLRADEPGDQVTMMMMIIMMMTVSLSKSWA